MTTTEMKIGALSPWYGAKRTLAPEIVREIGSHKSYWEPFCGSMATLFGKPRSRMETVNDLHGDLINLARVIQSPLLGPAFYRRARRQVTADDTLAQADALIRHDDYASDVIDPDRALGFWITSWMGRNGEMGLQKQERGRKLSVRWTPNGGDPATRYASAVSSLVAFRHRLRDVTILRRNAFDVLAKIGDDAGTVIYCDPPYLVKSDRYLHDFNEGFMGSENDHERLAVALRRFRRARVIVSYYRHPALAAMYPGWTLREFHVNKNMATQGARESVAKTAVEVLLINGPSLAGVA